MYKLPTVASGYHHYEVDRTTVSTLVDANTLYYVRKLVCVLTPLCISYFRINCQTDISCKTTTTSFL